MVYLPAAWAENLDSDLPKLPVDIKPGTFTLTEDWLVREGAKQSTDLKSIELNALQATINREGFDDTYQTNWIGSVAHSHTDINDAGSPLGRVSPATRISTGVSQLLKHGASVKGEIFQTNTEFPNAAPNLASDNSSQGILVELGLDLGANRFGRKQKLGEFQLQAVENLSLAQKQYQTNRYKNELRKLYWSLVANKIARKWRMELLSSARKQLHLIRKQKNEFVSDVEDVARFEALVLAQRSELISLDNQFEQVVQALKASIPSMTAQKVEVDLQNLEKRQDEVLACIQAVKKVPNESLIQTTSLQDVLKGQYAVYKSTDLSEDLHDSYELKLFANYESANNQELNPATGQFKEDDKYKSTVGIEFSVPIGGQKTKTKNQKRQLLKSNYLNDSQKIINTLTSKREASLKQIQLLADALEILKKMTAVNQKKLNYARKKYNQARIPLAILIQDEENLLNNKLQQVQLRLQVVHTLLDYLGVYDKTQCQFNAKITAS